MGSKKLRLFLVGLLVMMTIGLLGLLIIISHSIASTKSSPSQSVTSPTPTPSAKKASTLNGDYLISGDVFWGRGIDYWAQRSSLKYDWPFSRLSEFGRDKYDGWISDMECPVTNKSVPYQTQVDALIFSCSPNYLSAASKWFDVFTLANNHTGNTGAAGFADTQDNLANAGIQFFGHYDISHKNDLCEVVTLKVSVDSRNQKLPIAMCGYHWLARMPTDNELAQITQYAAYFPVWVFPHGGTEYSITTTSTQQELYHKMIDLGADVVFGDHPHVVESTEAYKGKLIVYDLGNLVFDQWFDSEVTKNMVVNASFSAPVDKNLQSYLDMADSCTGFKDNCLQTAQAKGFTVYKLQYSYKIMAGDSNNASNDERAKHLGSPEVQDWLLKRTNWQTTLSGLK